MMRRTEALVESGQRGRGSLIVGNNLPNFDQGNVFGGILPPLYSELKLFGEFGGGFIPRESGLRDISSRGFSSNGGLRGGSNVTSDSGLFSSGRNSLLVNFGSSI
jgi:hypothetical protein